MFDIIKTNAIDHDSVQHIRPALVYTPAMRILDYPYVWVCTFLEFSTADSYLHILRRLLMYLAERPVKPFDAEGLCKFWRYVTAGDIRAWQQFRLKTRRVKKGSASWETVTREAEIVVQFLHYVSKLGVTMLYSPTEKTVLTRTQAEDCMLKGIVDVRKAKKVLDYKDIRVAQPDYETEDYDVDEEESQLDPSTNFDHLLDHQIDLACSKFHDKVFEVITLAGLHTGLRNFEILGIPFRTAKGEFTSDPVALAKKLKAGKKTMELTIKGKGSKTRTIPVCVETWMGIMKLWWPIYKVRKKMFQKTGKELPLQVLWITKDLTPLYCDPNSKSTHEKPLEKMRKAFQYVSHIKDGCTEKAYGFKFNYYKLRHTFATIYVYEVMKAKNNWDGAHWIAELSIKKDLMERMGHKILSTTFNHYVTCAVLLRSQELGLPVGVVVDVIKHCAKAVDRFRQRENRYDRVSSSSRLL